MRKFLFLLIVCLLPLNLWAAQANTYVSLTRDLTETNYTYCVLSNEIQGRDHLNAVAASTTVTSTDLTDNDAEAFALVATGDSIIFYPTAAITATPITRVVTAKASGHSITISGAAITLADGTHYTWRKSTCGTAVTNGIVDVSGCKAATVGVELTTINATSITVTIEGKIPGMSAWATLATPTAMTAAGTYIYPITEVPGITSLRVGQKLDTDGGAQSLTVLVQCVPFGMQ